MPTFRTSRKVRHTAAEMFDLVADVERYPDFLPLCQSLKIRCDTPLEGDRRQLLADMRIGYKAVRESFVSRVTLDRPNLAILVEYVDGPFRRMENRWRFADDAAGASTVEFFLDYEFKSRMFGVLMGSVFDAAFRRFAESFEQRRMGASVPWLHGGRSQRCRQDGVPRRGSRIGARGSPPARERHRAWRRSQGHPEARAAPHRSR